MATALDDFWNTIYFVLLVAIPALRVSFGSITSFEVQSSVSGNTQPEGETIKIICRVESTTIQTVQIYRTDANDVKVGDTAPFTVCQAACAPNKVGRYEMKVSNSSDLRNITIQISGIQRNNDEQWWTCGVIETLTDYKRAFKLTVAAEPNGVEIPPTSDCDLAYRECNVNCLTRSCTYPKADMFSWLYTTDNGGSIYKMFGNFSTSTTQISGQCSSPEMIYKNTVTLPTYTTFPDNAPETIRLFCRLEFVTLTDQLNSNLSENIHMAVQVRDVAITQSGSTNILTVYENQPTELKCRTSGSRPEATVYWYKESGQNKRQIYEKITNENKSLNKGLLETTSTLMLQVTRLDHGWNVTCTADNFGGNEIHANNPKTLNILYSATVTSFTAGLFGASQSPENVIVDEYANVSGTCKVDGNPSATIEVSQRGTILARVADTLEAIFNISNATCYNNGKIICSAKNSIPDTTTEAEKSLQLNVKCSPRLEQEANHVVVAREGTMAMLSLTVIAYPPPDYQWHRYNKDHWEIIKNDTDFALTSKDLQYILTVTNVSRNHYGKYNLTLSNEHGPPLTFIFNLQNKGRPEVPVDISVTVKSSTAITVRWSPGYDGEVEQTFHVEYKPINANDWQEVQVPDSRNSTDISGLQPSTEYSLRMFASNEEGNSSLSETLLFRTQDPDSAQLAGIVGGAVGGVIAVGIVIAVIIFVVRGRNSRGMKKQIIGERSSMKEEKGGEQYNPNYENPLNDSNESEVKESSKAAKRKDKQKAPTNFSHDGLQYADLTFENTGKSGKQKKPPKPTATEGVVYDDVKIGAVGEAYYSKVDIKKGAK